MAGKDNNICFISAGNRKMCKLCLKKKQQFSETKLLSDFFDPPFLQRNI